MDFRGIPTAECPNCQSRLFNISVEFDQDTYTPVLWTLDAKCVQCGALLTAPTPLDLPENKLDTDI
jgi:DNA-directed RNA polymerase subunit RPC12/RpoP